MSSRLFKHQMCFSNRPPSFPHFVSGLGDLWQYTQKTDKFTKLSVLDTGTFSIASAKYSPDGKFLVIIPMGGTPSYYLYKRSGGGYAGTTCPIPSNTTYSDAAWSPDGNYLILTHASDGSVSWCRRNADDTFTLMVKSSARSSSTANTRLLVNPDSTMVAISGSAAGDYIVFQAIKTNSNLGASVRPSTWPGNSTTRGMVWLSPTLLLYMPNGTAAAVLYDTSKATPAPVTVTGLSTTYVRSVALSPDGLNLAVAGSSLDYYSFDAATNSFSKVSTFNNGTCDELAFSLDGKYLFCASINTVTTFRRTNTLTFVSNILPLQSAAGSRSVSTLAFAPAAY